MDYASLTLTLRVLLWCENGPVPMPGCLESSDLVVSGHFGPKTFRHHQTGAEVSGYFGSALVPNCLDL